MLNNVVLGQWLNLHVPICDALQRRTCVALSEGLTVSFIHTWLLCCAYVYYLHCLCGGSVVNLSEGREEWQAPPWHLSQLSPSHSLPSWKGASTSSCSHQIVTGALTKESGTTAGTPRPPVLVASLCVCMCVCTRMQFLCKLIGLSITASNITDSSWVQ